MCFSLSNASWCLWSQCHAVFCSHNCLRRLILSCMVSLKVSLAMLMPNGSLCQMNLFFPRVYWMYIISSLLHPVLFANIQQGEWFVIGYFCDNFFYCFHWMWWSQNGFVELCWIKTYPGFSGFSDDCNAVHPRCWLILFYNDALFYISFCLAPAWPYRVWHKECVWVDQLRVLFLDQCEYDIGF